jgi:phasin family protein
MQNPATSMIDSYQKQIDASRHIAEAVFDGTDRIEHLMIDTTRKAFDEQMKFYQALAAVRDPQGIAALQSAFFSHTPEQMTKVQQELMKIVTDAQHQITSTMDRYKTTLNGGMTSPMHEATSAFSQSSGNGSPVGSALTSIYSMWDKAFKESFAMANRTMATVLTPPSESASSGAATSAASAKTTTTRKSARRK